MLIPKVKICGITNYEDARAAIDFGADLIGFNFYKKSPRYIEPKQADKIITRLPAFVSVVGLFVNAEYDQIRQTLDDCFLNWLQLHGDETPEFCDSLNLLNLGTIKAIRVRDYKDIKSAEKFFTDAILLDAYDQEKYGGTGLSFDWNIVGHINKRIFLAGGINPDNVEEAIKLGVYGIDICSGIEERPGKKDHKKMKQLFENISHLRA
ncbi:MAG: phosphoribosylanthranilate isomerase [Sedimentisphaerales bacterium]|nr:phosphoribosylanthranilate isomerase [Sedimentisphaerales bacterium]